MNEGHAALLTIGLLEARLAPSPLSAATDADAYATAAFAMGRKGVGWVAAEVPGYAACAITDEDRIVYSDAFRELLAPQ